MNAPIPDHVIERARAIDIVDISTARGLKLKRQGRELVGPCPHCGGRDRFAIKPSAQAFHCRGCRVGGYGAIDFVRFLDGVGFVVAVERLVGNPRRPVKPITGSSIKREDADERERIRDAVFLWRNRRPIAGTIAERYLREARGYTGPLPATLGFLPAWRDVPPRMIAAFGACDEIEPGVLTEPLTVEAVHLTYLLPDGSGKASIERPKQFRGVVKGKPISIAPPSDLLGLGIVEGIEDALSFFAGTGLGMWAAGAAGFMPALADVVPNYIEAVTIFAHHDANGAGQGGALELADRLSKRGIEVLLEGF